MDQIIAITILLRKKMVNKNPMHKPQYYQKTSNNYNNNPAVKNCLLGNNRNN